MIICLIQYFEADFLWKVSLKILKTFTHDTIFLPINWHILQHLIRVCTVCEVPTRILSLGFNISLLTNKSGLSVFKGRLLRYFGHSYLCNWQLSYLNLKSQRKYVTGPGFKLTQARYRTSIVLRKNRCPPTTNAHKELTIPAPCVKWPLSKRPQIDFQGQLSLNAGQKYCRML